MRKLGAALGMLVAAGFLGARAATLEIRVTGLSTSGPVRAAVFASREAYEKKEPLREMTAEPDAEGAPFHFEGLPPGEYATRVFQDLNDNSSLDRHGFLPAEPFGFSGNFLPRLGPPSFSDLAFRIGEEDVRETISLIPPPRRGEWSAGAALIAKTESYRGMDDRVIPLPFVSYAGPRLHWFGPVASLAVYESGGFSVAGTARYTFDGYEQDDAPIFEDMPDRDATLEAGARAGWAFAPRWRIDTSVAHDLLGRHGGFRAGLGLRRTFNAGELTAVPEVALEWMDDAVAGYYYGVQPAYAREDRRAYAPDDAWEPRLGISLLYPVRPKWILSLRLAARLLPDELTDSPLVGDDEEITAFMSVSRSL
ncbi:MAG TPA: MipA/OmpV family protein [Kiritimatiellia bacterium]|nr:MipA/OmpV family protein [Kiritimatiellia bacterium]HRZ10981.1 MipA/OmpV family protein [Kiritimatiellia bacterium]HSA18554.1 MipA/OmpV family protein [Kiritimatiellia bacterium]